MKQQKPGYIRVGCARCEFRGWLIYDDHKGRHYAYPCSCRTERLSREAAEQEVPEEDDDRWEYGR